jgi:hypothetical protein
MKKLPVLVGLLLLTLTVASCAKMTGIDATSVTCTSFGPISWSKNDTNLTIKEIKAHNASWEAVCHD